MAAKFKHDVAAVSAAICARMELGESLQSICRDMGLPRQTVNDWRKNNDDVRKQFDAARDEGYDAIAERTRLIARGKDGSTLDVQRDKLVIDTDLKLLAKWDPRRYGDKLQHSNDPAAPMPAAVQFVITPVQPIERDEE